MSGKNNIYAYSGTNMRSGKKYNYTSISNFIKERKTSLGDQLKIFIKTDQDVDYKSTVNMLDQMAINNIKKYSLIGQNENEKNFIKQLK
jgi:biopolymer transport protein ExbD